MPESRWKILSPDWYKWLDDFVHTAERFTAEEPVLISTEDERELVAIKIWLSMLAP